MDVSLEFEEKPAQPKSNLASMGIYIFNWKAFTKRVDRRCSMLKAVHHDFGKDIIPSFLEQGKKFNVL